MKRWWIGWLVVQVAAGQVDLWDMPPLNYSDTEAGDRVAALAQGLETGEVALEGRTPLEKLEFVLKQLDVPVSSQVLVFSKTSKQIGKITPKNPRSLYFSEDAYVGYVPGGVIEVIVQDPKLGPVFYVIDPAGPGGFEVLRDTSECFSCHGTARTEHAPGVLIRSVYPDASGHALLTLGTTTVTHATPIPDRWGGYYVTGRSELPHLGNRTFVDETSIEPAKQDLEDVSSLLDATKFLRGTSDVVALVVLEHQCQMHNLMTAASLRYSRARFLASVIDPASDPDKGQAGGIADRKAVAIVNELLFRDEADLGDGLEGDASFQEDFVKRFPQTEAGDSLADFKLYGRLFKNRCSYMVYSEAFEAMPVRLREAVLARLRQALSPEDHEIAPHLSESEKQRIREILEETLPRWRQ